MGKPPDLPRLPDRTGHFGNFGGRYVPETLMTPLLELEAAYREARRDPAFRERVAQLSREYVGRPTPLTFAERLTEHAGGARIYLKREDLCHTGAHKINNTLGQGLLAARMGKPRVIAETGAGQHGVATATIAALLGLECEVYMGEEDTRRQALNVFRMELLGARVIPVRSGSGTLKDAMNEALRDWVTNVRTTYYCIGSTAGPHPYPMMVRDLQSVIGREVRRQLDGPRPCSWPAWAAGPTPSASSTRSSATARSAWSAWRRRAPGSGAAATRRRSRRGFPACFTAACPT